MPCTVALSRTIRATRRLSIVRGSSIPISIGRVLDELEEAAQQAALDAPARQRHVEEEGRVPEEREAPPDHAAHEGAVQQSHQRPRSEEHTSELQSHVNLVCRLLLEKK